MENAPDPNYPFQYSSPIGDLYGFISDRGLVSLSLVREGIIVDRETDIDSDLSNQYLAEIRIQLDSYFKDDLEVFSIDLDMSRLTGFQRKIYEKLRLIPFGSVITYGELGRLAGVNGGARAVGGAMGRNPYLLVVPCHRVISTGRLGSLKLGGFSAGLDVKRHLLSFEGSLTGIESE